MLGSSSTAPGVDLQRRASALQGLMEAVGADAVLLSTGGDLPYFTGYRAPLLERLTMLVVTASGEPTLFVPELEAPLVPDVGACSIRPWTEGDDPVKLVAQRVAAAAGASPSIAVGDQTWAMFVLALQDELGGRWRPAATITRELRMRKEPGEIDALRAAAQAADRVADRLRSEPFAGRTERDLAERIAKMAVEEGLDEADFAIVGSGPNGASPHHHAGERTIRAGDTVVIDFGGPKDGYYSDTTRTFHVGDPPREVTEAFAVLREAQAAACEAVQPGITAGEVDGAARDVIAAAGWGERFIHRTGHGIGLEVHEHPYITAGSDFRLEPGMAFSIEPGIYVPGRFGMRIEDIVCVTEDGHERLNTSDRDLAIVG